MTRVAALLGLVAVLGACVPVAATKLSLHDATAVCTDRAIAFGQRPWTVYEDEPPDSVVQDRYRACVFAKSGSYPAHPVAWRHQRPTPLRQAGS